MMKHCGIGIKAGYRPVLDEGFVPLASFVKAFLAEAEKPVAIAIERNGGLVSVYETFIREGEEFVEANRFYIERLVKTLLWCRGGFRVTVCGDQALYHYIKQVYSPKGARRFDYDFMTRVYERTFEVCYASYAERPKEREASRPIGRHLEGCRIGFDAGGSDRKVSAVIDGEAIYSEEVVWHPKLNADPAYHYGEIVSAFQTAASKLPRVDAIGVSSAGIYIDNRTMVASLFLKVPEELFERQVKDIYLRAAKELGDLPIEVCNDGDVTALAGAMSLEDTCVLGIAMGTSEAGGYVDHQGNITGWLNELAFTPCDGQDQGAVDEWSGDKGCGVKYFSQDAVIRLAERGGIALTDSFSLGEKLKEVQSMLVEGSKAAQQVFETIGCYLGHTVAYYEMFYDIKHLLLLGRVMSGRGGEIILAEAKRVLAACYPEVAINLTLPDEKIRRVGQSVAAASLPRISPK